VSSRLRAIHLSVWFFGITQLVFDAALILVVVSR